jgi:lysozyme family protein
MNFDQAFERVIGHEGGYVNNPADPGGETNFGISKRSYPMENIRGMTLERAKAIYQRDYWGPAGCDAVPDAVKFDLFDTAVNSGVTTAIRLLQNAAGVSADGVLGPVTLQAVNALGGSRVMARFNGWRLAFMANTPQWETFSRGWARRIAGNLKEA